jgi:hypothetical protein
MVGNSAEGWGGAVMADAASLFVFRLQIESNTAAYGAGLAVVGSCSPCMLDDADFRANVADELGGDIVMLAADTTLELTNALLHAGTAPHAPAISLVAGVVELRGAEVSGALSGLPDGAAIELGEEGAMLLGSDVRFMGNDPADLRVLPFAAEAAPGPDFTCASGFGCSLSLDEGE